MSVAVMSSNGVDLSHDFEDPSSLISSDGDEDQFMDGENENEPETVYPALKTENLSNNSNNNVSQQIIQENSSNLQEPAMAGNGMFNPLTISDNMVDYNNTGSFHCNSCGQDSDLVEDHKAGDQICGSCGAVAQERLIAQDAEYRVFSEDSASYSKIRIGNTYNPLMEYSLTEKSRLERDEKEFLWDGIKNIEDIFYRLSKGDSNNTPAQQRAKELFEQAFHLQVEQKKGSVPMKRSGDKKSSKKQTKVFAKKAIRCFCFISSFTRTWHSYLGYSRSERTIRRYSSIQILC